jgi:hypothetical protein
VSKSTIPMPAGYQDTIWLLDDETLERIRKAFAAWEGGPHRLTFVAPAPAVTFDGPPRPPPGVWK